LQVLPVHLKIPRGKKTGQAYHFTFASPVKLGNYFESAPATHYFKIICLKINTAIQPYKKAVLIKLSPNKKYFN